MSSILESGGAQANTVRAVFTCPACCSGDADQVGAGSGGFQAEAGGRTFAQPAFSIKECRTCGLYFKSHTLRLDELEDYYGRLDFTPFEQGGAFPTERPLIDVIQSLPAGSKVLDFGCSTGRLLGMFVEKHQCYGVEINGAAAASASSRGICLLTEKQLASGEKTGFDAAVLVDVYEHLPHPLGVVETLVKALKTGGLLVLVTGDADMVKPRERMAEYWYFQLPGHLHMLSRRHLEWLEGRMGLQALPVQHRSHFKTSWRERMEQRARSFLYWRFKCSPRSPMARLLRRLPIVNRAERWESPPCMRGEADHVIAVLRKR